jgi:hypothetical protein
MFQVAFACLNFYFTIKSQNGHELKGKIVNSRSQFLLLFEWIKVPAETSTQWSKQRREKKIPPFRKKTKPKSKYANLSQKKGMKRI